MTTAATTASTIIVQKSPNEPVAAKVLFADTKAGQFVAGSLEFLVAHVDTPGVSLKFCNMIKVITKIIAATARVITPVVSKLSCPFFLIDDIGFIIYLRSNYLLPAAPPKDTSIIPITTAATTANTIIVQKSPN